MCMGSITVALWPYIINGQTKISVGCVMALALQLIHNSRSSIGYQTVTTAHKNKEL